MLCLFILRPEHLNVSSFSMFQDSFERKERYGCDIDRLGGLYLIFHHLQCFKMKCMLWVSATTPQVMHLLLGMIFPSQKPVVEMSATTPQVMHLLLGMIFHHFLPSQSRFCMQRIQTSEWTSLYSDPQRLEHHFPSPSLVQNIRWVN